MSHERVGFCTDEPEFSKNSNLLTTPVSQTFIYINSVYFKSDIVKSVLI